MWGHRAPWTWPWAGFAGTSASPWDGLRAVPWDRRSIGLYPLAWTGPCDVTAHGWPMARPMGRLLWPGPWAGSYGPVHAGQWAGSLGPANGPAPWARTMGRLLGPAYALCPSTLVDHN